MKLETSQINAPKMWRRLLLAMFITPGLTGKSHAIYKTECQANICYQKKKRVENLDICVLKDVFVLESEN